MRSDAKMRKGCKIRFPTFVNFCESPNFQNQEIDIVIVVVGVRRVAKKSHIDVRRIRRISSDAEVDKIEVVKLTTFGRETRDIDDFWSRES